jgi:hypothetical protein
MSHLPDDARLERVARAVLAQLGPHDLDRLLADVDSLDDLVDAMVACAEHVHDHRGVPVTAEQEELLLLATLTRTRRGAGVHQNAAHAARRLDQYLLVPGIAVPVAFALEPSDSVELIQALDSAHRADARLRRERAEPPVYVTIAAAAAACLDPADTAGVAAAVLDRGMELAAAYQASDAPSPGASLPVLGDRGFLVQLAGYAHAVRERRGAGAAGDPMAGVTERARELEERIRHATTRPARFPRDDSEGPDHALALLAAAAVIGGDAAGADDMPEADGQDGPAGAGARNADGATARTIFRRLNRELWQGWFDRPRWLTPTDLDRIPGSGAPTPSVLDTLTYVDDVTARVVGPLTTGATREELALVADWVCGRLEPDWTDHLYPLLLRLRRLMVAVEGPPERLDPPVEPDAPELPELVATVRAKIEAQLALEPERSRPGELAAGALPPLWTARMPAIRACAQQIKRDEQCRDDPARILAARAARGPGQVVRDTTERQHDPGECCATVSALLADPGAARCDGRLGPFEPTWTDVCPARPWGERGLVESRATIAGLIGRSPEAVRGHVNRYLRSGGGRWLELVLADRP